MTATVSDQSKGLMSKTIGIATHMRFKPVLFYFTIVRLFTAVASYCHF